MRLGEDGRPAAVPTDPAKDSSMYYTNSFSFTMQNFDRFGMCFNFEDYPGTVKTHTLVIGIGRGKQDTFVGCHCEAYPVVRKYWLDHVARLVGAGFDGVLIRMQGHSATADDFKNYGFNAPITERYREFYGEADYSRLMDPRRTVTDAEYLRIMQIRGEFFMLFAEESAALCRENHTDFAVLRRESYTNPTVSPLQNEVCWWTMPKVLPDWKRFVELSDLIVIKDYIHSPERVHGCARQIREYAAKLGKPSFIECCDEQAGMINTDFPGKVIEDDLIDGVIIYEMTNTDYYLKSNLRDTLLSAGFAVQ